MSTNVMVFDNIFNCIATCKYYKVKGTLSCNIVNVVYLITCRCCELYYVRSAITFKERYHLRKSDINTGGKTPAAAKYFFKCCTSQGKFDNLTVNSLWNL